MKSDELKHELNALVHAQIPTTLTKGERTIYILKTRSRVEYLNMEIKHQEYIEKVRRLKNGK